MLFLSKNIRTLLTVKYTLVVALLMLMYSAVNLVYQYNYLKNQVDLNLKEDLEIIQEILLTNELIINPLHRLPDHHPKPYERFVEIWSDSGTVLYHSSAFQFEMLPHPPKPERYSQEPRYFSLQFPSGKKWRTIAAMVVTPKDRRIVRISMSEEHLSDQLLEIFIFMSLLTPLFLVIAVSTGYFLARQALKPIDTMVVQAKKIGAENLRERLTVINPNDELGNLATVTNELLDRIQLSFQQLKNFTADASHELRTPLTAMRSVGEVGLQSGQSPEYYREVIGSMLEENNRLTHLIDSLLFLSKADSEKLTLTLEEFDLFEFLEETKDILLILAEEKRQQMYVECSEHIQITADKRLLRRAVLNLIDNAIKYTPEAGNIIVTGKVIETSEKLVGQAFLPVKKIDLNQKRQTGMSVPPNNNIFQKSLISNSTIRISVADTGIGIPEEHAEKIFDRFYRLDKDRSRETGGVGLGLSIVQWIMSVHNGSVRVESKENGSVFIIELPNHHIKSR